jgi:hypothetical protein
MEDFTHQFEDMFLFVFIGHFGLRAGGKKNDNPAGWRDNE